MLKRILFLLVFSLLGAGPALAQVQEESLASKQLKQQLRGQYLTNDTAQAIITLYSRRQAGGATWIVSALLSAVRIGTASNNTNNYGGYGTSTTESGNNLGAAFLVSTPLIAYGVGKLVHYSNASLTRVLTAYAAGKPLPPGLRRKLKPRFFKAPIVPYKPVKYTPIAPAP